MFRRAETRERDALLRDTRAINDKVRLLARLGTALIEARENGADLQEAVASAIGWDKLARSVEEAQRLARPDKTDLPALAARAWPVLHRLGPLFLGSLRFHAVPAAAATLRAIELLRAIYGNGGQKWPPSMPTSFLRPPWREAVVGAETANQRRRIWEAATLLALRDRLRAGDIWVEGSRQWRAVEDQLIPPARFAAMREAGPLPLAAPATAEEYLTERRALLERRLAEVSAKAAADRLEDVRITGNELKTSPLKAVTPAEAEALADRLYAMMPSLRITSLLAEVDRWTGFGSAFTHLHSGAPAEDRRVVLTAVLADATNLGCRRCRAGAAAYAWLAWPARTWHCHLHGSNHRQQRTAFETHNGRSALAAGTGLHAPIRPFVDATDIRGRTIKADLRFPSASVKAYQTPARNWQWARSNGRRLISLRVGRRRQRLFKLRRQHPLSCRYEC
jgi:hypothetical protein